MTRTRSRTLTCLFALAAVVLVALVLARHAIENLEIRNVRDGSPEASATAATWLSARGVHRAVPVLLERLRRDVRAFHELDEIPGGEVTISSPEWEFPLTYRCDYGPGGEITVNEPLPVAGTAALGGVTVLFVSAIWWRLATGSPTPEYEGQHRS